jgi:hypothetical protein
MNVADAPHRATQCPSRGLADRIVSDRHLSRWD